MSTSFGPSFINKSNKKVKPKAPPPRRLPGQPGQVANAVPRESTSVRSSATPQHNSNDPSPHVQASQAQRAEVPANSQLEQAASAGASDGQEPAGRQSAGQQPSGQQPAGQQPAGQQLTGQTEASRKHGRDEVPEQPASSAREEARATDQPSKRQRTTGPSDHNEQTEERIVDGASNAPRADSTSVDTAVGASMEARQSISQVDALNQEQQPENMQSAANLHATNVTKPLQSTSAVEQTETPGSSAHVSQLPQEHESPERPALQDSAVTGDGEGVSQAGNGARGKKRQAPDDSSGSAAKKKRAGPRQQTIANTTQESDQAGSEPDPEHIRAKQTQASKGQRGRRLRQSSARANEANDAIPSNPWDNLNMQQQVDVPEQATGGANDPETSTTRPRRTRRQTAKAQQNARESRALPANPAVENAAPATQSRKARRSCNTRPSTQDGNDQQASAAESQVAAGGEEREASASSHGPAGDDVQATVEAVRQRVKAVKNAKRKKRGVPAAPTVNDTEVDPSATATGAGDGEGQEGEDHIQGTRSTSRRAPRRRSPTPSDAEDHRIDTATTAMWDLARDPRRGQLSQRERAMRKVDWKEVKRRRKEEQLRALEATNSDDEGQAERTDEVTEHLNRADEQAQETAGGATDEGAPALRLVNGQLVFDTNIVGQANNNAQAQAEAEAAAVGDAPNEEERDITKNFNTATLKGANKRDKRDRIPGRGGRWDEDSTDKFYRAIGMFGADFTIIQTMFPDKTRRQVKLKFVREEKTNPDRIREVMVGPSSAKEPMSLDTYAEMTGKRRDSFRVPATLNQELEAEKEQQQRELDKEREELEENVKQKREKARERQKEKERLRREKAKKEKTKGLNGEATNANGDEGHAGAGYEAGYADDAEAGAGYDDYDEDDYGMWDGQEQVTESIET